MQLLVEYQVHKEEDEVAHKHKEDDEGDVGVLVVRSQDWTAPHVTGWSYVLEVHVAEVEEEDGERDADEEQDP